MQQSRAEPRTVAVTAVMIAVVAVFTLFIRIPIPATEGYFNFSDVAIYFTAFTFGPWVGLVAGGVGACLADIVGGFPQFAILSLIAHGLEGFVAGYVGRGAGLGRMLLGWLLGAIVMILVYFLGEALVLTGLGPALTEAPFNAVQNVAGAIVGIPLTLAVRRAYPPVAQIGGGRTWKEV